MSLLRRPIVHRGWNVFVLLLMGVSVFALPSDTLARHRRCRSRCCRVYCAPTCVVPEPGGATSVAPAPTIAPPRQAFMSRSGRRYSVTETNEPGTEEKLRREIEQRLRQMTPAERSMHAANVDNFAGHDRKVAKTSIADAPDQSFANLGALLESLPKDSDMLNHDPEITEDADSDRVDEEKRNVTVPAFLYATKKEADNDYHLILGTNDAGQFMTAEVSGLPPAGNIRARLKVARDAFKQFFSGQPIGTSYKKFDPPIPVRISGSLFFDVDHPAGVVGPEPFKPKTAWEIHPVTSIEFEP
jgi:hypothetical protein